MNEELLRAILDAWNKPGRYPWFHAQAKKKLRETWLTLANALDKATKEAQRA